MRTDVEQSLTISQGDSTSESITNKTIRTSKYISINGGENRDVLYIDDNGNYQPIKVYVCTDSPIMIGGTEVGRNDAGYYSVDKTWQGQTVSFSVTSGVASEKVIIPFIKQGDTDTLTVSSGEIYTISSGKFTISSIEYTIVYVEGTQNIEKLTFNDSDEIDVTDNTFTLGDAPNQVEYTILRKNDTNQTPVSVVISSN